MLSNPINDISSLKWKRVLTIWTYFVFLCSDLSSRLTYYKIQHTDFMIRYENTKITISMNSCETEWNQEKKKTSVRWIEKQPKTGNSTAKKPLPCYKKKKSKRNGKIKKKNRTKERRLGKNRQVKSQPKTVV